MSDRIEADEDREDSEVDRLEVPPESMQNSGISIDRYGIKARAVPMPLGEARPKSWADVRRAVNIKLMSIALDLVALPADILEGSRKLVRGLTKVPRKAGRQIEKGHEKADQAESIAQKKAESQPSSPTLAADALSRVEAIILLKQSEGYTAQIVDLEDGVQALVFIKPDDQSIVGSLIRKELSPPAKPAAKAIKATLKTRRKKGEGES